VLMTPGSRAATVISPPERLRLLFRRGGVWDPVASLVLAGAGGTGLLGAEWVSSSVRAPSST